MPRYPASLWVRGTIGGSAARGQRPGHRHPAPSRHGPAVRPSPEMVPETVRAARRPPGKPPVLPKRLIADRSETGEPAEALGLRSACCASGWHELRSVRASAILSCRREARVAVYAGKPEYPAARVGFRRSGLSSRVLPDPGEASGAESDRCEGVAH